MENELKKLRAFLVGANLSSDVELVVVEKKYNKLLSRLRSLSNGK